MSFLDWLFGRSKKSNEEQRADEQSADEEPFEDGVPPEADAWIEQNLEYLNQFTLPAIALVAADDQRLSRIGGLPSLPDDVAWPEWNGKPLEFLCQINLAEISNECERNGLPESGMLYFFYQQDQATWGFDPKDEGSWRVIYAAESAANGATRSAPAGFEQGHIYGEKPVALVHVDTYPDAEQLADLLADPDENLRWRNWFWAQFGQFPNSTGSDGCQYRDLCASVFKGNPAHHLFGHPAPVQGAGMELECQLASHGLYCGDGSGYRDPRAKELEAGAQDWVLLLQLDTDDDTHMMWGDAGMLYFWIRKQDLQERRFDKCWMILQCG